jgi:hypothetical protein
LKWDRRQLVEPMEPARRMNVAQRNGKDQTPNQQTWQPGPVCPGAISPAADHMVALVDRFQKWFEMRLRPGFLRGRHEYQRQGCSPKAPFQ